MRMRVIDGYSVCPYCVKNWCCDTTKFAAQCGILQSPGITMCTFSMSRKARRSRIILSRTLFATKIKQPLWHIESRNCFFAIRRPFMEAFCLVSSRFEPLRSTYYWKHWHSGALSWRESHWGSCRNVFGRSIWGGGQSLPGVQVTDFAKKGIVS